MKVLVSLLLVIFVFEGELGEGAVIIGPGTLRNYLVETLNSKIQETVLLGRVLTAINNPTPSNSSDNNDTFEETNLIEHDEDEKTNLIEHDEDEKTNLIEHDKVEKTNLIEHDEDEKTHLEEATTPVYKKKFSIPALNSPEYPYKANWFRAYQHCRLNGMHLAAAESEEEHTELVSVMKKNGLDLPCWISATDLGSEGEYVWMSSGKQMTYNNWGEGEPNNIENKERCVIMFESHWNDVPCDVEFRYVCEYFEHQVPE